MSFAEEGTQIGFRKVENLTAAVSVQFLDYNLARPHKTLSKPYPTT